MNKALTRIFVFLLCLVLFFNFVVDKDIDAVYMQNAFLCGWQDSTNNCLSEGFKFPLLYYLTIPFYLLLGNLAFTVLPLLLFFGSIVFLIKIIELAGLKNYWVIPLLLANFLIILFVIYYTRDSLNFFLASAFAYFYFKALKENENYVLDATIVLGLMFFANPQAIAFLLFYVAFLPPIVFSVLPLAQSNYYFEQAIQRLLNFKLANLFYFYLPFYNFFLILSLLCFLFNRQALFFLVLLAMVFVSGMSVWVIDSQYPDPNPEQLAVRYGLEFVPLLFFFVAQTIKRVLGGEANGVERTFESKGTIAYCE